MFKHFAEIACVTAAALTLVYATVSTFTDAAVMQATLAASAHIVRTTERR